MCDYYYIYFFDHYRSDFDLLFHLPISRWFVLYSLLVKPICCSRSLTSQIASTKQWGRFIVEIPFVFYRPPPIKQIGFLYVAEKSESVKPQER